MDRDSRRTIERALARERAASAAVDAAVRAALQDCSYADVARVLGISRQAARKRWPGISDRERESQLVTGWLAEQAER